MKTIKCEGLDKLQGSDIYPKLKKLSDAYKKRAVLGAVISFLYLLPLLFGIGIAYISVFLFTTVFIGGLTNYLNQVLGSLLSEAIASATSSAIYWLVELVLLAPFLVLAIVLLQMLYGSVKSLIKNNPNVAKTLYFAENIGEVEYLTIPNRIYLLFYQLFKRAWDSSFGRAGALNTDKLLHSAYSRGGIIARTPVHMMPITAVASHPASTSNLRVSTGERNGYAVLVMLIEPKKPPPGPVHGADIPEIIAVFDPKYKKEIVEKIRFICPETVFEEV